jgi:hypothetical protein
MLRGGIGVEGNPPPPRQQDAAPQQGAPPPGLSKDEFLRWFEQNK